MTQISEAKKGIITKQMKEVSKNENIDVEMIRRRVASGKIVIPFNPIHFPRSLGIGKGLRVKVNANIGTSREHCNTREEIEKAKISMDAGAHAVMDLSTGGDLDKIRISLRQIACPHHQSTDWWHARLTSLASAGTLSLQSVQLESLG